MFQTCGCFKPSQLIGGLIFSGYEEQLPYVASVAAILYPRHAVDCSKTGNGIPLESPFATATRGRHVLIRSQLPSLLLDSVVLGRLTMLALDRFTPQKLLFRRVPVVVLAGVYSNFLECGAGWGAHFAEARGVPPLPWRQGMCLPYCS